MGDYALAMQFDNAPTVPNADQADTDSDGTEEEHTAVTDVNGYATVTVTVSGKQGTMFACRASWDGGLTTAQDVDVVRVGDPVPPRIVGIDHTPGVSTEVTAEALNPTLTYRLVRSPDLLGFPDTVASGFEPQFSTDTLTDENPPAPRAFYRVEEE